jgi:ERCC4-related helicase
LITHLEMRAEDDPELVPYTHQRQIDIVVCQQGAYSGIQTVRTRLNVLMGYALQKLNANNIIACSNPHDVNFLVVKDAEE